MKAIKRNPWYFIVAAMIGMAVINTANAQNSITISPLEVMESEEDAVDFPFAYPYMSWGEVRWSDGDIEDGLVFDAYVEQGVDWAVYNDWTMNTFAGLRVVQSDESGEYWNNKLSPRIGAMGIHEFELPRGFWASIALGARGEFDICDSSRIDNEFAFVPFALWSAGGDWKNSELSESKVPAGYPIYFGGELRYSSSDVEEGLIVDANLEQGIDWMSVKDWTFNTFASLRVVQSTEEADYWNNKIVPAVGIKWKHPIQFTTVSWGEASIGARLENNTYTSDDRGDDFRAVVFLNWSLGGDLKKN